MSREKIDDQMVAQWVRLHQQGESYRSIGRKFGVDYRTVKSWIQRAGKEKESEHWETVSQQVDAKYLDEHYRMLMQMTSVVTNMLSQDPMNTTEKQPSPVFLNMCIQSATLKATQFLVARGLDLTSEHIIDDSQASRLGHRLFDALMEHEPLLKTATEEWESEWINFQKTRLELMKDAKNLFKNAKVADAVAEGIKKNITNEVLRHRLLGEEPLSSRIDTSEKDDERIRNLGDKYVRLIRCNGLVKMTVYRGSEEEVGAACEIYDKVFSQLCHEDRIGPVQVSYLSLTERIKEVKDYVDRLILIGRPQGQCPLCLNQSTRLL